MATFVNAPGGYRGTRGELLTALKMAQPLTAKELADRFGPPPPEVERLLDATILRVLGREVGVDRILVRGSSARITFRADVVPKIAALEDEARRAGVPPGWLRPGV